MHRGKKCDGTPERCSEIGGWCKALEKVRGVKALSRAPPSEKNEEDLKETRGKKQIS